MKTKLLKYAWGVFISSMVILTLACIGGWVSFDYLIGWKSVAIFTCLSLLSFTSYAVNGSNKWGWLFPALISAALALNASGLYTDYEHPIVAFPILLSISIPFYVGYFLDRKQWGWLIPAWILTVIALIPSLLPLVNESLLISIILCTISFPFIVSCITNPERRWCMIPVAFFIMAGVIEFIDFVKQTGSYEYVILLILALSIAVFAFTGARVIASNVIKVMTSRRVSS